MSTEYHFENKFPDYSPRVAKACIENGTVISSSRLVTGLEQKWQFVITALEDNDPRDLTVYTGLSGAALLYLRKDENNREYLQKIRRMIPAPSKFRRRRFTFLCGDAGPLAIGAIVCFKLGEHTDMNYYVETLRSMESLIWDNQGDVPNEYLYGRVGYLYGLLYVNNHLSPPPFDSTIIRKVIETIFMCGKNLARAGNFRCPLMYQWHDSYYLGAAHGVSGILYLLLQARNYLMDSELQQLVLPTIDFLTTLRFSSGNYPSSLGRERDTLVQWCHGAPGFVFLFTAAYRVFGQPEYLQSAIDCGEIVWKRGLLQKGYSLCHGVAGNAYCFLELYQTTKDEKHLYRAIKFAEWCFDYTKDHERHSPDTPLSLYEGMAGSMYLLLDIQKPLEAKFPGFTL